MKLYPSKANVIYDASDSAASYFLGETSRLCRRRFPQDSLLESKAKWLERDNGVLFKNGNCVSGHT